MFELTHKFLHRNSCVTCIRFFHSDPILFVDANSTFDSNVTAQTTKKKTYNKQQKARASSLARQQPGKNSAHSNTIYAAFTEYFVDT